MTPKVAHMREVVESYMDDILRFFVRGSKITVLVRPATGDVESEVLLTNDSLDEVTAAVERAKTREDS